MVLLVLVRLHPITDYRTIFFFFFFFGGGGAESGAECHDFITFDNVTASVLFHQYIY